MQCNDNVKCTAMAYYVMWHKIGYNMLCPAMQCYAIQSQRMQYLIIILVKFIKTQMSSLSEIFSARLIWLEEVCKVFIVAA